MVASLDVLLLVATARSYILFQQ